MSIPALGHCVTRGGDPENVWHGWSNMGGKHSKGSAEASVCPVRPNPGYRRLSQGGEGVGEGGESPRCYYLCTVYVLYGYYASAVFLSSVDFTKETTVLCHKVTVFCK